MKGSDKDMMKKLSAALLALVIAAGSSAAMVGSAEELTLSSPSATSSVEVVDDDTPEPVRKPMNADLMIPSDTIQAPDKPVALKAARTSAGLKLTWNTSNNCDGYYVYREHPMGDSMGYNFIYLSGKNTNSYIWSDYSDTYKNWTFAVVAYNIDGNGYVFSDAAVYNEIVDETASSAGAPSTPAFTSYNKTYDAVRLFWNPVACEGYDVEYNTNTGYWVSIGTVSNSSSNARISKLEPSTTYKFRIRAFNLDSAGNRIYSGYSSEFSATTTTKPADVVPVAAPAKTTMFSSSVASNQVTVGWNAVSCSGYQLYYNVKGGKDDWIHAGNFGNDKTSYTLSGLNANSNVWFTVRAFNKKSDGTPVYAEFSDNIKVTTSSGSTSPATKEKPAQVKITKIGRSTNAFRTYWDAVACDGYEICYNATGYSSDWKKVDAVIPSSATNYRIEGLTAGHDYWVTVRAYNNNSNGTKVYGDYATNVKVTTKSSSSSSSSTTPTSPTATAPAKPVINKTSKTYDAIRINWNSIACSGYDVYLNSIGGSNDWKFVTTLGSNATTYRAENLQPNHKYWMTIVAFNKDSNGKKTYGSFAENVEIITKSNSSSSSTNTVKPAGTAIYKTSVSKDAVRLNWNRQNCGGYLVYQLVNGNTWKLVKGIKDPNNTTCRISGLYSGTTYFFKVRTFNWGANNKKVTGPDSGTVAATTKK